MEGNSMTDSALTDYGIECAEQGQQTLTDRDKSVCPHCGHALYVHPRIGMPCTLCQFEVRLRALEADRTQA